VVSVVEEEAHVDDAVADDDGVRIGEMPPGDVDGKVAGGKTGKRAAHATLKFVDRRARTDRFAYRERQQLPNAQRRRECEGG